MNRQIAHALTVAGATLAATAAIVTADKLDLIGEDMTIRLIMAVIGINLIWTSNATPKLTKGDRPALTLAVSRSMVLGGLVFTVVWLAAPIDWATPLSMLGVIAAMGVAIASCVSWNKRAS